MAAVPVLDEARFGYLKPTDVARHRQQHLAEVLGLRVLGRLELDPV